MSRAIRSGILALVFVASEALAQFCPGLPPWVFDDVPITHPFCTDITWMAQRGVTLGCALIDPNHRLYCPDASVDRGQMAAFMHRLGDALFPLTCAAGQVMKWNGLAWACANDNIGGTGGGGTVTSVAAGTGLTANPNPIIAAGVMAVDTTTIQSRVTGTCTAGSSIRTINANGTVVCETDDVGGTGTVTSLSAGTGITLTPNPIVATGSIAADTAYLQRRVSASCVAGSSIRAIAADGSVTCETDDTGPANAYVQGGNSFGTFGTLGTSDNQTLALIANGVTSLKIQPTTADLAHFFNTATPNVIGGWEVNAAYVGVIGATIGGGGGDIGISGPRYNLVTDHYGTVGGGAGNTAGDEVGTRDDQPFATVGGGYGNSATGSDSTVGGGHSNLSSGSTSTVGGGLLNTASGTISFVGGGYQNTSSGDFSTVIGGRDNTASGDYSFAVGQDSEARGNYSVAIGRRAKTFSGINDGNGAIVLADGHDFDFEESFDNRFAVRSTGGVRFVLGIDAVTGAATYTCSASNGNAWACASDRNLKHSVVELDGKSVLERLASVPIYKWQPKGPNAHVKHYGPMAQDFHAAFGLGDDEKMIGMQDADGVALAAIQGLNAKLESAIADRDARLAVQGREIVMLNERVARAEVLQGDVAALKAELAELRRERAGIAAR